MVKKRLYSLLLVFLCHLAEAEEKVDREVSEWSRDWAIVSSENYKPRETVIGALPAYDDYHRRFSFSSGAEIELGGKYLRIGYLPKEGKADILVVVAVNAARVSDDSRQNCNVNWFLFDLTKSGNPFTPGKLSELCFDSVAQFGPEFYREGNKYFLHFTSSISESGIRQPNVKYIYDRGSGELVAEVKDPKTKLVTKKLVQEGRVQP